MGSAESTGRSNGDDKDEGTNSSGETPDLGAAAAAIGGAAVAAWAVKKMLFDNKGGEEMNGFEPNFNGASSSPPPRRFNGSSSSSSFAPSPPSPPPPRRFNGSSSSFFFAPSPPRRFKLKTDGACHPHGARDVIHSDDSRVLKGPSGYAGILENDDGNYVRGFRGFIGVTDCFTAELNGVLKGLELLDKLGCMESVLESDCQAAVQWVTRDDSNGPGKSSIVGDCWELIKKCRRLIGKNKITVRHLYRDVNKDVDKLATVAIKKRDSYVEFTDVFCEIKAAAGTAMAAWGISRMISNSESKEKDNPMKIKAHETESSFPNLHIYESIEQYESKDKTAIWSPPPARRLKMNTDATCKGTKQSDGVERGPSGFGGILRNDSGEWVRGFLGFIDHNIENLAAEIYSINGGLELLDKDDRYGGSFLENDHQEAVNWINGKYDRKPKPQVIKDCWKIIEKSRQLALKNNITIGHVVREANYCADRLAEMAVYTRKKYLILENRPNHDDVFERRYKQDLSLVD